MGQKDRESRVPASQSAETDLIDASWDDDELVSGIELAQPEESAVEYDDVEDRVTAIPSMPPEMMARELMAQAPETERPRLSRPTPATPTGMQAVRAPSLEMPFTSPSSPGIGGNEPPTQPPRAPSVDDLDLSPGPALELDLSAPSAGFPTEAPTPVAPAAAVPAPTASAATPEIEMKDRYAMGDFTGALVVAESILEADPGDEQAQRYAESCRDVLTQMYSARLGPTDQRVVVAVPPDQIRWLSLDHRAGFLLSMIDGTSNIDEILDISGMARLEAMRILFMLYEQQVIRLEPCGG
ncbi:MAG TPA: hypothetical protein PKD61_21645 [Polyangiaceae bacterium]|nr:hypothetical protein [Polyangiaceae bacterium]